MNSQINFRISEKEKKVWLDFADLEGFSLTDLIKESMRTRIEDQLDISLYQDGMLAYLQNPNDVLTFEEVRAKALAELGNE